MPTLSETQQRDLLIAVGLGDFLVGGKLTSATKKALMITLRAMGPIAVSEAKGLTRLAAAGVTGAVRAAPRLAAGAAGFGRLAARTNPYSLALLLAYEGYIHRDNIAAVAESLGVAEAPPEQAMLQREVAAGVQRGLIGGPSPVPGAIRAAKRKVSKANRAVKQGMTWLKAGTKAATGAKPGKLPRGAFKTVVRAAGLANPKTKSRISKGKSIMNKLARRLKKWW